jgi:hypothetical protein
MTTVARPLDRPALNVPALGMSVAAIAALALALRAPIGLTLVGFVLFGALHNLLELRYVLGRFAGLLSGRFLAVLLGLITAIALARLVSGRYAEIVLGYAVLIVAGVWALRGRRFAMAALVAVLAGAAALSLTHPAPSLRGADAPAQPGAARVHLGVGAQQPNDPRGIRGLGADHPGRAPARAGRWSDAARRPHAVVARGLAAVRRNDGRTVLAVFAFLQSMHYVVWVWLLPRYAPAATARFEQRLPGLKGWRIWALGAFAAAILAIVLWADYGTGRGIYASLAGYHAYLEFPVLLVMLMSFRKGQS